MIEGAVLAALVAAASAVPAAFVPVRAQAAQADPAKDFEAGLAQVRDLVQRGSVAKADQQLKALLEQNKGADHARRRQADLVDLAKRCAFRLQFAEPKPDDLVAGDLVRWDAKNGDLEVRYSDAASCKDFVQSKSTTGSVMVHPAVFGETVTLEADFPANLGLEKGPQLLVGVGTDEEFLVCFGTPAPSGGGTYTPPQIVRLKGETREVADKHEKPALPYDKPCTLKVVVGSGSVTAYRDSKRLLQAKRTQRESGQIALVSMANFRRLTLRGKAQPSWIQGLLDAETQKSLTAFESKWKPKDVLPAWLFEPVAAAAPKADAQPATNGGSADYHARLVEMAKSAGSRTLAEREAEWKALVAAYPREVSAWHSLALLQMRLGHPETARATCDAALTAGVTAKALEPLPQLIAHTRDGPDWTRVFTQESAHYVVKSDIDKDVCAQASQALEESYRSYGFRLAPVPGIEKKRFTVFLFSGRSGYLDYARDSMLGLPESTAGLYSSTIKQLLIWNLPDRAEMFRTVRHEGFHQYFDRLAEDPPIWFNEGMAEYFELADVYGGEWQEGQVHHPHQKLLGDAKWVPMRQLLDMDTRTFQGDGIALHYAESWAIVHWLRRGPKDAQAIFQKFWGALIGGKPRDVATNEAFGDGDLAPMQAAVDAWVRALR
jgi:hypothetical protein